MAKQILVVDDDAHIREVIVFTLEKSGMRALEAVDGAAALKVFEQTKPDLVVLDISMPEMDGLEVCRRLRRAGDVPVLFLSSRDEEIDKIIGLEIGGDDYMTKPFSPRELVARINVILKRFSVAAAPAQLTQVHGRISLDVASYTARAGETLIPLTATEFMLLVALFRSPHKVFTRDELMDGAYGVHMTVSDRTIDSHIRRIRGKFAAAGVDDVISTAHGIGYKMGACGS